MAKILLILAVLPAILLALPNPEKISVVDIPASETTENEKNEPQPVIVTLTRTRNPFLSLFSNRRDSADSKDGEQQKEVDNPILRKKTAFVL